MHNPAQAVDNNEYHDTDYDIVKVAKQIALKTHTQHHGLVSTKAHGLLTIEPR